MRHFPAHVIKASVVLCLFAFLICGSLLNNATRSTKMEHSKKSFISLVFSSNATWIKPNATHKEMCRWLKTLKHPEKLCRRRRGLPELLHETRKLAVSSCMEQFEYEQWNCSRTNIKKYFKKIFRETALMHSLVTSALMYTVARACAEGKLANCKCASHGKSENSSDFEWGGCGDNIKYAKKLTKKILQLKKKGDNYSNIIRYNSEVGMKAVVKHNVKKCDCHGMSKSCTLKICFMRVEPFVKIAENLRQLYHTAVKVKPDSDLEPYKKKTHLVFLENSPNFCGQLGAYGVTTSGRRCKDENNCATLCCTRGHTSVKKVFDENCKCKWIHSNPLTLQCAKCAKEETFYYCR
ncbi:protein Wnt-4 [Sitophilus oryzae]|uniref:Protein Wnt n=1 Tax=Sitophilus oryzae TaxID=7048 RepID=A0A6J2YC08_SITOR|nr:protein Wnt-4 [Sitophilus oryzae]